MKLDLNKAPTCLLLISRDEAPAGIFLKKSNFISLNKLRHYELDLLHDGYRSFTEKRVEDCAGKTTYEQEKR